MIEDIRLELKDSLQSHNSNKFFLLLHALGHDGFHPQSSLRIDEEPLFKTPRGLGIPIPWDPCGVEHEESMMVH